MFPETPIYNRLIAEQGDIPAQVRGEAQRLGQELERVMPPGFRLASAVLRQENAHPRPHA
ncbi:MULTISPECIES: hypothetical protein [unclassified Streptomyces]|uniref:hypothetical protein n=1 Tax=unclassified Streptomyces TaxID=2593676 RepID=UPI002250EF14|nr:MULTISPECIES: hypothetical protein [unclassified Streptomyces]MCX4967467.1 hypothetical protein [Streptomyces sp. NBC_00654]MEE1738735.1 hypothetical protein [Streptomyces sp. BE147]